MNLLQLIIILRARIRLILIVMGVTFLAALVVSLLMPKVYKATTSVVVDYKASDPVTGLVMAAQALPGYMPTQVAIITSQSTALKVVDQLKLASNPTVRDNFQQATGGQGDIRQWLAAIMLGNVTASPSKESSVIDITYKNPDPEFAAVAANAFADAYRSVSIDLKTDPSKRASQYFNSQLAKFRTELETAQNKLSQYQSDNGIVGSDDKNDYETARLNELAGQLTMAQAAATDANSRQVQSGAGDSNDSPEVANSGLIQGIKSNLVAAEARFAQVSQRVQANHPDYIAAQAEVGKLRSELASYTRSTSASLNQNATNSSRRVAELSAAVAKQKSRVLEVNRARDQMAVLARDVDSAQRAYDTTAQRFNSASLEGESNQAAIVVLSSAMPPYAPSSPRIFLNLAVALVMGLLLGVGAALLLELTNRRIRSSSDLTDMIGVPVLGVIPSTPSLGHRSSLKRLPM